MSSFAELQRADRRLVILRLLMEEHQYRASEMILWRALELFGHAVALDVVRVDMDWLAEAGLLTVQTVADIHIATLTTHGLDAATGRATVSGVQRPAPGER